MTTTSTQLTEGQQAVISAYDSDIAHHKREMRDAYQAWFDGDDTFGNERNYEDFRSHRRQMEELIAERADVLATFQAENASK